MRELEDGVNGDVYQATPEELAGIERELKDVEAGRFAGPAAVEAAFAKFHG
jgi:hypothetical protein